MKLRSLTLSNFRGIRDLTLEFSDHVNVLVGVNGAGKTAILDCAAIMLSRLVGRIRSTHGTGRFFVESDISNGAAETRNRIDITFRGSPCHWSVTKTRKGHGKQTITRLDELKMVVTWIHSKLDEDESLSLPVAVYYPVNRAVLDIPLRIRKEHRFDQLAAFDQALSGDWSSFRVFFEWFRNREDVENEIRADLRFGFRDRELQAVRTAIERFLPDFSGLKVRRKPLRMEIAKSEEVLRVDQLSDGEKCTLAMVGDLARRMALANPALKDPLTGDGVVLIDEIDLHLHPGWQRHFISTLPKVFPNCQFLVSTHSPPILSHVPHDCIWILERNGSGVSAARPVESFGQTAGSILEDLMGVPERPPQIQEQLSRMFYAIKENRLAHAKELMSDLRNRIGRDPELVNAEILIRRIENSVDDPQ